MSENFTPTPEAVVLARKAYAKNAVIGPDTAMLAAIAAFVEAEGLRVQTIEPNVEIREWAGNGELHAQRLVSDWRKRD